MNIQRLFPALIAVSVVTMLLLIAAFGASAQQPTPYPTQTPYPSQTPYPTFTPVAAEGETAPQPTLPPGAVEDESGGVQTGDPDVEWVFSDRTFVSGYPHGMTFEITLTSSAAPIESARVVWTHAPRTQNSQPAEIINAETGDLIAEWEHTDGNRPPWLAVNYWWEVTDELGNTYRTPTANEEYEDNTREWLRAESEDIVVIANNLPQTALDQTIEAMARQRATYRGAWGDLLPFRPRAILFGSRDVWEEWQEGVVRQTVIGTTNLSWGATVQLATNADLVDLSYGTVPHEVAHLYQAWFSPVGFSNGWMLEGNATFFELSQQYDYEGRVRQAASNGQLPVLLDGLGPNPAGLGPDGGGRWGYDVGYTFFKWLVQNYGLEGHRELAEILTSTGVTRNEALEIVTGLSALDIETQWREWLGASGPPPTIAATWTPVRLPSPTPFVFPTAAE